MKKKNQQHSQESKITLDSIINDSLKNLKNIIDANTVVGNEIKTTDGTIIIPISKIIVGFVAGGGELETVTKKNEYPFAGGTGAGFTVVPIGFLTGQKNNLTFVSTKSENKYDELINLTNKALKMVLDNVAIKNNSQRK